VQDQWQLVTSSGRCSNRARLAESSRTEQRESDRACHTRSKLSAPRTERAPSLTCTLCTRLQCTITYVKEIVNGMHLKLCGIRLCPSLAVYAFQAIFSKRVVTVMRETVEL
jgi:hypothetical protein